MNRLLCILNNVNMGGAETFLMKIYRSLDRTKFQMDFCINVLEKCDYEDEIAALGGRIFRIPPKTQSAKEFKRQLTEVIRGNGYQNVLRITSNAAGFWDLKIAKKAGATHTIARSSNASDGSFAQLMIHKAGRLLWEKYVDVKIAPSDLAARYTFGEKAIKRNEVKFLNNGLDLDVFRFSEQARADVRTEFSLNAATKVIGHIGRFNTQKNHLFLLQIFHDYLQTNADAVLVLVGTGDLEEQIRQKVVELHLQKKVIFTGLREDVPALLSAFDVLLLPSFYEGMPNVVIEAQACGLPCILSDTITREANLSGKVAYLPISDTAPWIRQMNRLLTEGRVPADMRAYDIHLIANQFCQYCY